MALDPANFIVNLSPKPVKAVIGMTGDFTVSFSNTSATERGYNLSLETVLPDGVSFVSSSVAPTSVLPGPNETIIVSWTNIKDLAPGEVDFAIGVTVSADETFRETGLPVHFDTPLISIDVSGTVDTLPRGDDDPGNEKITKEDSANFIPLRYNLTKSGPGKRVKGAGLLDPVVAPLWPYEYTLTIMNNSREASTVTLVDNLPNGVRYLNNLTATGPDAAALSDPTVIIPDPGPDCQDFVTLDWGTVELSENSVNVITFDAAIWDNFTEDCVENSGDRIPHMTPLQNIAELDGLSGPVEGKVTTNAMDATIRKSVASASTDVGQINSYTLTYRINQYDDVGDFVITDIISDGQSYNAGSASKDPDSVTVNPDGTTELIWELGLLPVGTQDSITFTTTTDATYADNTPVSSDDTLKNNVNINGINQTTGTPTPDSSSVSIVITIPFITKEILDYYYADGTVKPFDVAAPGDEVEFRITYSSEGIDAEQRNIEIDEYAPLNMGPLTDDIDVTYGGTLPGPFEPFTVTPNGLRWDLGTVPGDTLWTATFKVPVQEIDFVGTRNNLAKLAGENREGFAYSDRDQVEVNFGAPEIEFEKTVSGPDVNAIKAGEVYTYTITVSNPQNDEGTVTDAFEMDLTDVIPDDLTFTGDFNVATTGVADFDTPQFIGQNVSMTILQLGPDASLTLTFDVEVDDTVVSGQTYTNDAVLQRPYSQPDRSYQFPGDPFEDSATLKAEGLSISKAITPIFAKIGDTVTYIIEITVPLGTTAFNVQLTDQFPDATQDYIDNSATKDGASVTPDVVGGTVTFPVIPFVDATTEAVTIEYSFDIRVTDAAQVPPYSENQPDTSTVSWDVDDIGTPAVPATTTENLEVRVPFLTGEKEQRNVTKGQTFRKTLVDYDVGDEIEYRITIINNGTAAAFDIEVTDELDPLLEFNAGSIVVTQGSASHAAGTVTWEIPVLDAGETATLTFSVTTLPGVAPGGRINDKGTFIYKSNDGDFFAEYGPDDTNTVQLRAASVTIDKGASISDARVGSDIEYTITIVVPEGTIAYHPLVDDILPDGQTYIGPATRQRLPDPEEPVTPTVVGQTVTFPQEDDIDATAAAVTIIYTFTARVTDGNFNPPYTQNQTDTGRVRWAVEEDGPLDQERTDTVVITVRTPDLTIIKEQRNVTAGDTFTTNPVNGLPGDLVEYRLLINSIGASPAFNIILEDLLSDDLTFDEIVSGPTAGNVTPPDPPPGAQLLWEIDQLNAGTSAEMIFSVTINPGIAAGDKILDQATADFDSNDENPETLSDESNEVTINIPPLDFEKTASTEVAAIGQTITYTLTVTIPDGVEAYNLVIKDAIPLGQEYVPDSWSPGDITSIVGNEITYEEPVSPVTGPAVLEFTFDTVVTGGQTTEPFVETQTNEADVFWDLSEVGPAAPPVSDFAHVEIKSPHITALKEQRNVTQGGDFVTTPLLDVVTGDIVEYRITLTNTGESTAYNIVTTDELDENLAFIEVVPPAPPGTVDSSVPPGEPDGTITWTEETLDVDDSVTLTFSVEVLAGPPAGTAVFDQSESLYDTDPDNPTTLGPAESNQVGFNFTQPIIEKTVDDDSVFVGDTVTYTVSITISEGNIAYNVQVSDVLPGNQSYVEDSLTRNGEPIPSPTLDFPFEGTVDAIDEEVTIVYTFQAAVDSIDESPQEEQVNTATIDWTVDEEGEIPGEPQSDTATVFATDSDIEILKEQRNVTRGGEFTKEPIQVFFENIIEYKLTVTNTGPNPIYEVIIEDILSGDLAFIEAVSVSAGTLTHSGEPSGGTVTWTIPELFPEESADAVFSLQLLPTAREEILNQAKGTFQVDPEIPDRFSNKQSNITILEEPLTLVCIITDKIFDRCKYKKCFDNLNLDIPQGYEFHSINFKEGYIIPDSLRISPVKNEPDYRKVQLKVVVPYIITFVDQKGKKIRENRELPVYTITTILFMPGEKPVHDRYTIDLLTVSKLLFVDETAGIFSAGVMNIISAIYKVQLYLPTYGYCLEPEECAEKKCPEIKNILT